MSFTVLETVPLNVSCRRAGLFHPEQSSALKRDVLNEQTYSFLLRSEDPCCSHGLPGRVSAFVV